MTTERKKVYRATQAEKELKDSKNTLERLVALLAVMIDDMVELGKLSKEYRENIEIFLQLQDRKTRLLNGIQKTVQEIHKLTDGRHLTDEEDESVKKAEELIEGLPQL